MLAVRIAEEGGLAEGFVVKGEATEGILARDVWNVREGCQAGGIDKAGGGKDLRVGRTGDLPRFVGKFGDVSDGSAEANARTEVLVVVDVRI